MAHNGHFMEGRLSIEQDQVSVAELTFDGPPDLYVCLAAHCALVKTHAVVVDNVANARVLFGDHLAYRIIVESIHVLDHGERLGDLFRNTHVAHIHHGVPSNDRARRVITPFAHQRTTYTPLLAAKAF